MRSVSFAARTMLLLCLLLPCSLFAGKNGNVIVTSNTRNARALAIICQRITKCPVVILPDPWSPQAEAFLCLPGGNAPSAFPAGKLAEKITELNPETVLILGKDDTVGPEPRSLLRRKEVNNDVSLNTWENNSMALANYFNEPGIEKEYRAWKRRCDTIPDPARR